MSTAEDRMREAFDALTLPPDVKAATLATIEQTRSAERAVISNESHVSAPENVTNVRNNGARREKARRMAKRPRRRWAVPIAAAACLVAAVVGFGGYTAYATETAVVGIEINPSIELGINRFDTVVAARALNDDGDALLAEVSVAGDPYAEAIEEIAASDTFAELGEADAVIDVSVVCGDDAQARSLMQTSDDAIAACDAVGSCHRASSEDHEAATNAGMGIGRYAAAEELMALDPSVALDDCQAMSMREIVDAILAIDPDNAFAQERCGGHHGQGSASGSGANSQGAGAQGDDVSGSSSGHGHGQTQGQGQGRHHGWEER